MNIPIQGIKQVATRSFGKGLLVLRKYSPEILTTLGVAGVVTSAVLASKATLKLEPIVDRLEDGLESVRDLSETSDSALKGRIQVYTRTGLDIAKLYAPAVTLGVGSIACIIGAHGIMRRRNVALIAAYNVLEKGFNSYRQRVIEEFGEEKDRDFRLGIRDEKVKDEVTGKMVTKTSIDPNAVSIYGRWFDQVNSDIWSNHPETNLIRIRAQQAFANQLLQTRGYVFLNEIYESLGMESSSAGQVVGWTIGKDGDNYIDFGLYDFNSEGARRFINGSAPGVFLDFNVDGVIIDKIDEISSRRHR